MKKHIAIAAIAALTAAPIAVFAAEEGVPDRPVAGAPAGTSSSMFEILDTNKDGYLTPDEAKKSAELTANWKALDRNGDGRVSPDEYGAGAK